jgi:hypothetical protein
MLTIDCGRGGEGGQEGSHAEWMYRMVDLMFHSLVAVTLAVVGFLLIIDGIPEQPAPQRHRHRRH